MITATINGKVFGFEEKTTSNGKKYTDINVINSFKDANGEWQNEFIHVKIWESAKNYAETTALLKTLKVGKPLKDATKVNVVCTVRLGEDFKTKAPKIEYGFLRIELADNEVIPAAKISYDNIAPAEEKVEEKDEEMPF